MYKSAEKEIRRGLSLPARFILGSVSAIFGIGMIMLPISVETAFYSNAFGIFFLIISLACFTKGKFRQFVGSLMGCSLFLISILYLYSEIATGPLFFERRSEPSVLNAVCFLVAFGIPGISYAAKVQFGRRSHKKQVEPSPFASLDSGQGAAPLRRATRRQRKQKRSGIRRRVGEVF